MKTHAQYQRITPENLEKQYKAMNPSLHSDSSSQDSVESSTKNFASKQNKQIYEKTTNQQVTNMYPWGYQNNFQQIPPSVPPMVYPPAVPAPNNITISFNTAPIVPNMPTYPMFNQGFGPQQHFLHTNSQQNNNHLFHHQTNSNISNNDNFMKQLAREGVCKQLRNKDE